MVWLGAEFVECDLVADGWCWLFGVASGAVGMCGWELLVVVVNG